MKSIGIWIVTFIYIGQAIYLYWDKAPAQATILLGYSLANLGLIWTLS